MSKQITILGSGMAGCLAGVFNSSARILEAQKEPRFNHKALLRFKTNSILELTGIPMKKVTARKFIWDTNKREFTSPNPMLANQYSLKVTGAIGDRSIWSVGAEERYIPPQDFHEQLVDMCSERIEWGVKLEDPLGLRTPSISTIPMNIMAGILGEEINVSFKHQPIYTRIFGIDGEGYQTIYYPTANSIYRASLSGSMLIIESMDEDLTPDELSDVYDSFGFGSDVELFTDGKVHQQSLGKISPIDEQARRAFIVKATSAGVYSLGRFATWRNIGLDDVIHDLAVIRRLINADHYQVRKEVL